ncbi:tyrosine/phenylalanine carboxypeptidase domain-containing protein [Coxiella endosymbiont of Ornithodoros amblus]|uniref:tyrosine/phenylalanine carboxypeptidase domain-containing protein n=1 Tax=Coxiella endosymbiont of Ornithodoros amblus TaxID=1656166 RepID=UPI003137F616
MQHQINPKFTKYSAINTLIQQLCREYPGVIHLLKARVTQEFSKISQNLYGSCDEAFYAREPLV